MHITLAFNYDKGDSTTLATLFDRFENVDASSWELRLYSRDIRIGSKQVNCYIRIRSGTNYRNYKKNN